MKITVNVWQVALVFVLACSISLVSGVPTEMQADDWSASTLLDGAVTSYIKPYTGPIVERVTNSTAWDIFGRAVNRVQGAINLTGGFLYTYYEDHLKDRVENSVQWVKDKTKPIVEQVQNRFEKKEP